MVIWLPHGNCGGRPARAFDGTWTKWLLGSPASGCVSGVPSTRRRGPLPVTPAMCYRDVEELLAERGLDLSYETVRRWVLTFGPAIARRLRRRRPRQSDRWHLDEMVVRIAGRRMRRCGSSEPRRERDRQMPSPQRETRSSPC